jgi:predicted Fe-Mo cluster-binding NifX family protein
MMIGLPTWNGRLSPVMDSAQSLTLVSTEGSARRVVHLDSTHPATMAWQVRQAGVTVLICGAISLGLQRLLQEAGIEVIGWLKGDIEEIITAYQNGQLDIVQYRLPGCGCGAGRRRRQGGPRRRGRHREEER